MAGGIVRRFLQYLLDPGVPFSKKIWFFLALFYFLSPLDLIPEPIFGFGFLDDVAVLIYTLMKMGRVLDDYKVGRAKRRDPDEEVTIEDVEYKVHKD